MIRLTAELREKFRQAGNNLVDLARDVLQQAAEEMTRDIKGPGNQDQYGQPYGEYRHACPYKTGNLRNSYEWVRVGPNAWKVHNDAQIAHYAVYQEFGPRPHFRAAYEYWAKWAMNQIAQRSKQPEAE